MFIWDFVADTVLGQITDWVYGQIVGFLGSFFAQMGNMGADLFEMEWVQAIVMFFSCFCAWEDKWKPPKRKASIIRFFFMILRLMLYVVFLSAKVVEKNSRLSIFGR